MLNLKYYEIFIKKTPTESELLKLSKEMEDLGIFCGLHHHKEKLIKGNYIDNDEYFLLTEDELYNLKSFTKIIDLRKRINKDDHIPKSTMVPNPIGFHIQQMDDNKKLYIIDVEGPNLIKKYLPLYEWLDNMGDWDFEIICINENGKPYIAYDEEKIAICFGQYYLQEYFDAPEQIANNINCTFNNIHKSASQYMCSLKR